MPPRMTPSLCFRTGKDPSQFASESSVKWAFIEAFRQAQDEGRAAAFNWADYTGECDYDAFDEAYCGEAESEADFAYGFVEDHGLLNEVPESLRVYFDYEAYARICSAAAMSSMKAMYSATDTIRREARRLRRTHMKLAPQSRDILRRYKALINARRRDAGQRN
uniref:Antirestriction protein (ArdA) n=1 Tax=Klebsiella pneumoniae TaxID=573 RepID=A0A2P1BQ76_KLEPN|nr:Antirestriction protein (ArdA) [Klebsiella pneumoniae]